METVEIEKGNTEVQIQLLLVSLFLWVHVIKLAPVAGKNPLLDHSQIVPETANIKIQKLLLESLFSKYSS